MVYWVLSAGDGQFSPAETQCRVMWFWHKISMLNCTFESRAYLSVNINYKYAIAVDVFIGCNLKDTCELGNCSNSSSATCCSLTGPESFFLLFAYSSINLPKETLEIINFVWHKMFLFEGVEKVSAPLQISSFICFLPHLNISDPQANLNNSTK